MDSVCGLGVDFGGAAPGLQSRLELDLDWASNSAWLPLLVHHTSKLLPNVLLIISMVYNNN